MIADTRIVVYQNNVCDKFCGSPKFRIFVLLPGNDSDTPWICVWHPRFGTPGLCCADVPLAGSVARWLSG